MCLSAFPCTSISCNSSRMHALCAAVTTSFCPSSTLDMADRFFWQHSFPAASILLMCLLAQYTLCFFLVAIFHQLLSTRERASYYLKQPPPSLPWYGLILQPLSNLFSAGSFSKEEVRTPRTCCRPPHSPVIQILKAFPAPFPFIFETPTL